MIAIFDRLSERMYYINVRKIFFSRGPEFVILLLWFILDNSRLEPLIWVYVLLRDLNQGTSN